MKKFLLFKIAFVLKVIFLNNTCQMLLHYKKIFNLSLAKVVDGQFRAFGCVKEESNSMMNKIKKKDNERRIIALTTS